MVLLAEGFFIALVFSMNIVMGSYCTFKLEKDKLITCSTHCRPSCVFLNNNNHFYYYG